MEFELILKDIQRKAAALATRAGVGDINARAGFRRTWRNAEQAMLLIIKRLGVWEQLLKGARHLFGTETKGSRLGLVRDEALTVDHV